MVIILIIGIVNYTIDPFGFPKGASPNCGPEGRRKYDAEITSRENFINFIKNNKMDEWLDNFKDTQEPDAKVNWDRVTSSIKTERKGSKTIYSLDYTPSECSSAQKAAFTFKITNDGYASVYGCCGK